MVPDRQYAFDDMINYSVSDTGNIVELSNRLLYARTICLTIYLQLRNSRNKILVCILIVLPLNSVLLNS